MKKIIVLVVILFLIVFSALLIFNKVRKNQRVKEAYDYIPEFQIADLHGNIVTENSLQKNKSTLFLFFEPECDHCIKEFEQVNEYRNFLSDFQMVFVSSMPEETIEGFLQQIDFQVLENMFFLRDKNAELLREMDIKVIPSVLIYNKNRQLIKRYIGQVKVETLISHLSE